MSAKRIGDARWEAEVPVIGQPVVVAFWSRWSTPCRHFLPVVDHVARDLRGRMTVLAIDLDDDPAVGRRWEVTSLPTVLVFRNGRLTTRIVGTRSYTNLLLELDLSTETPQV